MALILGYVRLLTDSPSIPQIKGYHLTESVYDMLIIFISFDHVSHRHVRGIAYCKHIHIPVIDEVIENAVEAGITPLICRIEIRADII